MKKLFYFANLLLMTGILSCANEEQTDSLLTERNNPYDYVGMRHNEGIYYLATNYDGGGVEEVQKLIGEYGASKNPSSTPEYSFIPVNNVNVKYESNVSGYLSMKDWIESNQEKYREEDRKYLFIIANMVDDFIDNHQDFNRFKNEIAKIEAQILNDKKNVTKPMLLGMTSIAIHSAEYWYDYHTNPSNLYRKIKAISEIQSRYILDPCTITDIVAYASTYDYFMSSGYSQSQSNYYATNQATYESVRCIGGF